MIKRANYNCEKGEIIMTISGIGSNSSICGNSYTSTVNKSNIKQTASKENADKAEDINRDSTTSFKNNLLKDVKDTEIKKPITSNQKTEKKFKNTRDFKDYLYDKFDCLKSKDYSVTVSPSLLSRAAGDEKTQQWLERELATIPECYQKTKACVNALGSEIQSYSTTINDDGSITTVVVTQPKVNPKAEKAEKEAEKRLEKKKEERKAEKKKFEEQATEKLEEKKEYHLTIEGKSITEVTSKLMLNISSKLSEKTSATNFSAIDVKI